MRKTERSLRKFEIREVNFSDFDCVEHSMTVRAVTFVSSTNDIGTHHKNIKVKPEKENIEKLLALLIRSSHISKAIMVYISGGENKCRRPFEAFGISNYTS